MATSKIVARPSKNEAGDLPLYVRVSHDNRTSYVSLKLLVAPRHWNDRAGEVRKTHTEHQRLNRYIEQARAEAERAAAELLASGRGVTAARVAEDVRAWVEKLTKEEREEKGEDFFAFADRHALGFFERGKIGTWKKKKSVIAKLKEYHTLERRGGPRLEFEELTVRFFNEYRHYLEVSLGNGTNTVHSNMAYLRTIVRRAIEEGLMKQADYPFFQIRLKKKKTKKRKLSVEEIDRLFALELPAGTWLDHTRNYFLFAFYAGGVRIGDVLTLTWDNIRRTKDGLERVDYDMRKTEDEAGVPLVEQAVQVLDRYRDRRRPGRLLFPAIEGREGAAPDATPLALYNAINAATAQVNLHLKELAVMAEIETRLTTHVARHSLANYLKKKGKDISFIQQVLRHKDIKTTQAYLKSLDEEDFDDEYRSLF